MVCSPLILQHLMKIQISPERQELISEFLTFLVVIAILMMLILASGLEN